MPVRKFTWNDLPALLDFVTSGKPEGSHDWDLRRQTFTEIINQPWLSPEDNCFVLDEAESLQGFCLLFPELPIRRAVLEVEVTHQLALGSQERELVRCGIMRARELNCRVAHVCLTQDSPMSSLLQEEGFTPVRTYWSMVWNQETLPHASPPYGFWMRHYREIDAPILAKAQNDTFTGSWGFSPNTVEQIAYRSSMSNTSHEGIWFLFDGKEVAGYCWTCRVPNDGNTRGIISMIGVTPPYRGKGVSKPILLAGMRYLKSVGVDDIGLEVDGNNTPAIRLYQSVGFEKTGELHWHELRLT